MENIGYEMRIRSQFSVASTISVAVRIYGYSVDINGNQRPVNSTTTFEMAKGATVSTYSLLFTGNLSYTITSVSPTEDDSYIYTF